MLSQRIIYLVQRFRPELEGTSKEVETLWHHFPSMVHDLHDREIRSFKIRRNLLSYHFLFYPLTAFFLYLSTLGKTVHIYTTLRDRPYLPLFHRSRTILTSTNYFTAKRLLPWKKYLQKVKKIVVEAELQRTILLQLGLQKRQIELVYPPVDLKKFTYRKATGPFKILNASCPSRVSDLERRGMSFLMDSDPFLQDCAITVLWRVGEFERFRQMTKERTFKSLRVEKRVIKDMNEAYATHHCTIIPYTRFDEFLKLVPNSAIESLAAGKPVLISSKTGISELVEREQCGVVFEPTRESLLRAIALLRDNYARYQKNCRPTAEKYFSQEIFIKKYEQIYTEVAAPKQKVRRIESARWSSSDEL